MAILLSIPNISWNSLTEALGGFSLVAGTLGSIISVFIPNSFTKTFQKDDFTKIGTDGFEIVVQAKIHGLGSKPTCQAFDYKNGFYQEAGVVFEVSTIGDVSMRSSMSFDGNIVLR